MIQKEVNDSDVLTVILVGVVEVTLALHIPTLTFAEQEGIRKMIHVGLDGVPGHGVFPTQLLLGVQGVGHVGGIGERTNGRAKKIQNGIQYICSLDFLSFQNVLQIDLGEKRLQVGHFGGIVGTGQNQRHPSEKCIVVKGFVFVPTYSRIVFRKAEGMNANFITAASELGEDIGRQYSGIAAGDVDIQIGKRTEIV